MNTPQTPSCNCGDSVLSTTANILSILTFAYIIVIGSLYQYALHQRTQSTKSWSEMRTQAAKLQKSYSRLLQKEGALSFMGPHFEDLQKDLARMEQGTGEKEREGTKWHVVWRGVQERQKKMRLQERLADFQEMLATLDRM
jgi:biopolymer transport protein ExbB/TolQ